MITVPESDDELLAECQVETFRSSGKGGQHVNKVETAVRLRHGPSGIVVSSQKERSQYQNKRNCLEKLRRAIDRMNYRPPKRIPTKVPNSAVHAGREEKIRQSEKKKSRKESRKVDDG
jgi:protein subunit release factor B